MREHRVRHLPVLDGGQVLGVLPIRDIYLVQPLPDVDPATVTVEEAISAEPYSVAPDTPLVDVVREMEARKYGAAVVMEGREVKGIFTTVDALRALAERLWIWTRARATRGRGVRIAARAKSELGSSGGSGTGRLGDRAARGQGDSGTGRLGDRAARDRATRGQGVSSPVRANPSSRLGLGRAPALVVLVLEGVRARAR